MDANGNAQSQAAKDAARAGQTDRTRRRLEASNSRRIRKLEKEVERLLLANADAQTQLGKTILRVDAIGRVIESVGEKVEILASNVGKLEEDAVHQRKTLHQICTLSQAIVNQNKLIIEVNDDQNGKLQKVAKVADRMDKKLDEMDEIDKKFSDLNKPGGWVWKVAQHDGYVRTIRRALWLAAAALITAVVAFTFKKTINNSEHIEKHDQQIKATTQQVHELRQDVQDQ
jgi:hypothetical protein